MNVQKPASVIAQVQEYTALNPTAFFQASEAYLNYRKRKTFDLQVQNGLRTLIELRADVTTLTAFVLFQMPSVERVPLSIEPNIEALLHSLEGLREITSFGNLKIEQSADSVRKMLLAMSKDLRVVLVLMSLRYAELFELDQLSPALRKQIARQTLDIYVPIAGRLGIYTLKRKLEDHCFSYLSDKDYQVLQEAFEKRTELQDLTVRKLVKQLSQYLKARGLKAEVSGRVKGKYSTYMKLKRKGGGSLDEVYDLLALRVVLEKQTDCYTVLSLVNNHWQPITGRFKDYIAMPKVNGYRSLHTTVLGMIPESPRPVEIQIRTQEMHREAEYGIAAHWWYEEEGIKQKGAAQEFVGKNDYQERLHWVKNLVHLQDSIQEGRASHGIDFFSDRIFAMTLSGRVVELPKGATPLDFAYHLSESLGHHCAKAKVNGSIVPLDYELRNGDRVFIVKKMEATPNLYWLSLVKTERAQRSIRKWLLEQGEDTVLDQGVRLMNNALRRYDQMALDDDYSLLRNFKDKELSLQERKALLMEIGQGKREADQVVRTLVSRQKLQEHERVTFAPLSQDAKGDVVIAGERGFKTKLAACCNPSQGQSIRGYVTRGGFISVHHRDCKVLASLDKKRFIEAHWTGQPAFREEVSVSVVVNVANLLAQLSEVLRKKSVSLTGFQHTQHKEGYQMTFDMTFQQQQELEEVLRSWRKMNGVLSVDLHSVKDPAVL